MNDLLRYTMTVPALLLVIGASSVLAQHTAGAEIAPQRTCRVVALFAKFPDEAPKQTTPPSYAEDLFQSDLPGSFTHFYNEMSLGKFTVEGVVLPKYYTSDRPASGYGPPEKNPKGYFGTFNREVLENADLDVDFGRFDNDGPDGLANSGDDDGCVDFIFVIVKSNPPGFFPGGATGTAKLDLKKDFITNDPTPSGYIKITSFRGATQRVWNFASAVGIMAHEFGHALGLPDLYDLSYEGHEDDSAGIGCWGLMGQGALGWDGNGGPVPFCAWSREQLGWAEIVEITEDGVGQVLTDVATTGKVYKIPQGEGGSYYLLENRQSTKSTYDRRIPQDGLLIWHIRSGAGNGDECKKKVDLVCADGLYLDRGYPDGTVSAPDSGRDNLDFWAHDETYRSVHAGNLGDATDVFDGVQFTAFTPYTNPKSEGGTWIEHIRRSGTDLIADIQVPRWS
ncbi:MAG: M6 family metalloprotease domain-containing protein, partial [Candidatus Latescibacteria bacterium]|nr:M6 family metalloprotease domain-containing protein [Candidatus Latescibacterota bacterium]